MNKKQEQMMVLLQDLCLAFIINSAATILNGGFTTVGDYLIGMFMAFSINYIAGIIIPVNTCGNAIAHLFRCKEGSFIHKLIRIFVVNAIFVTIISFGIALINIGPKVEVFEIWWKTYWILHLVGFVSSVLLENGCIALAKTFVKD